MSEMIVAQSFETLIINRLDSGVVVLTINRPHVRNAVDHATAQALGRTLDALDADSRTRAIILTGAEGFFSAGMDLKAFGSTGERPVDDKRGPFGLVWVPPEKPLIAAVEGAAMGGGFEIALACDLIVASENSQFGLPETKRGLTAGGGGLLRLPHRIPYNLAMEAILTGRPFSAKRAAEFGMVNRLTAAGGALEAALELAEEIASNGPLAVRASKKVLTECGDWPLGEQLMIGRV